MIRAFSGAIVPLLALLLLAGPAALQAGTISFTFEGVCAVGDCEGFGRATLVLQDYTPGNDIDPANFVSFHYNGTNLVPAFDILAGEFNYVWGLMPAALPAEAEFHIGSGYGPVFDSWLTPYPEAMNWQVMYASDMGTQGRWSQGPISDVPEPGAYLLVAAGMAVIGLLRVKVRT